MGKRAIRYAMVDAFAAEPFKGNPAAVCLLEEEGASAAMDDRWMQSVAAEFNLSDTAFLARDSSGAAGAAPRFHLRWFTPVTEVDLCGHATLASAHFLFTIVLPEHGKLEFMTKSGILTAKKVPAPGSTGVPGDEQGKLFIELDFPMIGFLDCNEMPSLPETLNGATIVSVHKSATDGDLIVELSSGKEVVDILPSIDEIKNLACRGLIVTGPAPAGSGYDFFTRFFCPKFGIDEDPVTGSIHCVLAPYWGRKLGKQKLTAFQASPRGGTLYLQLDDTNQRVQIQGEALTVMDGTLPSLASMPLAIWHPSTRICFEGQPFIHLLVYSWSYNMTWDVCDCICCYMLVEQLTVYGYKKIKNILSSSRDLNNFRQLRILMGACRGEVISLYFRATDVM